MSEENKAKLKRIEEIQAKMEKDFGAGTLMGATDKSRFHEVISTGSLGLDKALGVGGLPKGRIIEFYGPESSGKTTLALHVIAEAHKEPDSYCAMVDAEHAIDIAYAEALGVDLDRFKISQPDYGEQALEITSRLVESGDFDVVLVDSVAALVPKSELDGEFGEGAMGKHARLMSQAMRKLTAITSKSNTTLIFINQLREKIGSMGGNPEVTTGGNALKFYASIRLDIRRSIAKDNVIKDAEDAWIGTPTTFKVVKNKVAPPFKTHKVNIIFGEGIDKFGEVIDIAIESGIITKAGSWFSYEGNKIGQGRATVVALLKDNEEMFEEVRLKVIQSYQPVEFVPTAEEVKE